MGMSEDCQIDLAAFWRLAMTSALACHPLAWIMLVTYLVTQPSEVAKLDNDRPLTHLDLRVNPIGPGTRRCWRGTMAPNIRCEAVAAVAKRVGSRAVYHEHPRASTGPQVLMVPSHDIRVCFLFMCGCLPCWR